MSTTPVNAPKKPAPFISPQTKLEMEAGKDRLAHYAEKEAEKARHLEELAKEKAHEAASKVHDVVRDIERPVADAAKAVEHAIKTGVQPAPAAKK